MFISVKDSPTGFVANHEDQDVTSVRFSEDGMYIAVGAFNGDVYIHSAYENRLRYQVQACRSQSPITSVRWHPTIPNAIVCSSASGHISSWHVESKKMLWDIAETQNSVNSLALSPNGHWFATAGQDSIVRYYNIHTKEIVSTMEGKLYAQGRITGHTSRVFSCIFVDENTIASSGWDSSVILWDTRTGDCTRTIIGPHVCGESMAVNGNTLITGSWRERDQLQFWDLGSCQCLQNISIGNPQSALQIYTLALSKDKRTVAVGGSDMNCAMFYKMNDFSLIARTEKFEGCVSTLDLSDLRFAIGLPNSSVYVDNLLFKST